MPKASRPEEQNPADNNVGVPSCALRTKRVEFWTAFVILLTAIITSTFAVLERFRPVEEQLDIKPLEGVWDFSIQYQKYQGMEDSFSADGKAIIIWRRVEKHYVVYFGANIMASGDAKPIMTGFSKGYIDADADGFPNDPFTITEIRFIARTHRDGKQPSKPSYEYRDCKLKKIGKRGDEIEAKFDTPRSSGTVRFKWSLPLH